jgi:hypothetical protein
MPPPSSMSKVSLPPDFTVVSCAAYFRTWRWWHAPPKCRLTFNGLHGVIWRKILPWSKLREEVNRFQMDIKRKTCDIRTWKKTFISRHILYKHWSLYQCVETRGTEVFWLFSQLLPHLVRDHLRLSSIFKRISQPRCEPLPTVNRKHFFMNILSIESFCQQKSR